MACTRQKLVVAGEYTILVADLVALFAAPEAAPAEVTIAVAAALLMVNSFYDLAECLTQNGESAAADSARRNAQDIEREANALKQKFGVTP
jgi:hypothetical protein